MSKAQGSEAVRSAVAALNDLPQKQFREALLRAIAGLVDSEGRSTSFLEDLVAAQSRTNAEASEVEAACVALGLSKPVAADIATAVSARRVDVTISSSSVSRVMRPSVVLELGLSDGRSRTLEAGLEAFQGLRYAVAKALADMNNLDAHPALKISTA